VYRQDNDIPYITSSQAASRATIDFSVNYADDEHPDDVRCLDRSPVSARGDDLYGDRAESRTRNVAERSGTEWQPFVSVPTLRGPLVGA